MFHREAKGRTSARGGARVARCIPRALREVRQPEFPGPPHCRGQNSKPSSPTTRNLSVRGEVGCEIFLDFSFLGVRLLPEHSETALSPPNRSPPSPYVSRPSGAPTAAAATADVCIVKSDTGQRNKVS